MGLVMPLNGETEAMTKETRRSKTVYVDVSGVSESVALLSDRRHHHRFQLQAEMKGTSS